MTETNIFGKVPPASDNLAVFTDDKPGLVQGREPRFAPDAPPDEPKGVFKDGIYTPSTEEVLRILRTDPKIREIIREVVAEMQAEKENQK